MIGRYVRLLVPVGCLLSVLLAACGVASPPDGSTSTQSPTMTAAVTPDPSVAVPVPSTTGTPGEDVSPTVPDLEQHLTSQSQGLLDFLSAPAPGAGEPAAVITCQGIGPIKAGDAITCRWEPARTPTCRRWSPRC